MTTLAYISLTGGQVPTEDTTMSVMTTIAFIASLFSVGIGVVTIFAERGYSFDLRRRNGRRKDSARDGGRRQQDGATTAA